MYKKIIKGIILAVCVFNMSLPVLAKVADTKIVITATDVSTDTKDLRYAINSSEDSAFTKDNVFEVKNGESYTIYVKDLAGNITSKIVDVTESGVVTSSVQSNNDKSNGDLSNAESLSGNTAINVTPYEKTEYTKENENVIGNISGQENIIDSPGTDISNVIAGDASVIDTTGTATSGKEFYTIQTKDEHTFFLVIDHNQGSDNVYFLDQVTENDLMSFLPDGTGKKTEEGKKNEVTQEEEEAFLEGISEQEAEDKVKSSKKDEASSSSSASTVMIIIIAGVIGGVYYYFKIYKPKKMLDLADDIEDIEILDDEEIGIVEFAKADNQHQENDKEEEAYDSSDTGGNEEEEDEY